MVSYKIQQSTLPVSPFSRWSRASTAPEPLARMHLRTVGRRCLYVTTYCFCRGFKIEAQECPVFTSCLSATPQKEDCFSKMFSPFIKPSCLGSLFLWRQEEWNDPLLLSFLVKIIKHLHHEVQTSSQQERQWMYLAQAWLIHSSGDVRAISVLTQNPDRHPPRTSILCLQGAFKKFSPSPLFLRQRRYDSGHKGTHQSHSAFWNYTLCASNLFLASRAKYTIILATERTQAQVLQAIFPGVRTRTYHFIFQDLAQL